MAITTDAIRQLREKTGAGIMDCRRALEQAEGVESKAIELLHKQGLERAANLADIRFQCLIIDHRSPILGSDSDIESCFVCNQAGRPACDKRSPSCSRSAASLKRSLSKNLATVIPR